MYSIWVSNRLSNGSTIGKLFYFLCFTPSLKTPHRFSLALSHFELNLVWGSLIIVYQILYMYSITVDMLINWFSQRYTWGGICAETDEFRMSGIIHVVLYHNISHNYIKYDVSIKPHKTRRQSRTPFSLYTFENSGSRQRGSEKDQYKYLLPCSGFWYTCYLHT